MGAKEYGSIPPAPPDQTTVFPLSLSRDPRWPQRFNRFFQFAPGEIPRGVQANLFGVVPLSALGPEDIWPEELRGTGQAAATATATTITEEQIRNPPNSGRLVVVEQVTLSQLTLAVQLTFAYNTADLPTPRNAMPTDMRQTGGKIPGAGSFGGLKAVLTSDTPTAVPVTASSATWGVLMAAGSNLIVPTWIVLPEGIGLMVASGTVGVQTTLASFVWREIALPLTTPR